ncbi:uncharacterized protein NMK_1330 [Novimethylophilus kurashikiensis]|uniref:DUF6644 domain-containing protein n=1 Tax=Novimethylophilus kurashikiensis TaxID=1825523 RepID=A0A2R5F7H2_9PROT|nr:DUF6644 family protein [Novimethylophilus kurashikiensis]GBG13779.1 uncharacterized protein NMK_1330 [Novimethylophilus kurashikiensis]
MSAQGLFDAIQHSALSDAISKLDHLFGAVAQLGHITGLVLLLSSIVLVNLRLLGWGLTSQPITRLATSTNKLIWSGLALLAVSGLFIFIPAALIYYVNPFFWYKAELIVFALIVQLTLFRWATRTDEPRPLLAKGTAVVSLALWFGVGAAARVIGFLN